MAYFPNGTSGMDYESHYCDNCVHWQGNNPCPVMGLHMLWNYEGANGNLPDATPEAKAKFLALDYLIPRSKDKLGNEECKMFIPTKSAEKDMLIDKSDALKEWEALYGKRAE